MWLVIGLLLVLALCSYVFFVCRHTEDSDEVVFYNIAHIGRYAAGTPHSAGDDVVAWNRALPIEAILPRYFKYKEKLMVPIRSQGKCASCWAFAVTDMLADRVSVHTGGRIRRNLSVQELLSCFQPQVWTCGRGGVPELAYTYPMYKGLLSEEEYPYGQEKTRVMQPCTVESGWLDYVSPDPQRHERDPGRVFAKIGSGKDLCTSPVMTEETIRDNIRNMKAEIFTRGPIVGTIYVYDDLYRYDAETVYTVSPTATLRGGHAIVIFGWCDAGVNTDEAGFQDAYWIASNSWGKTWPKRSDDKYGYFYIRMGTNEAGIESRASACDPLYSREMDTFHGMGDALRENVCYTSYTSYVQDPERINFFDHLKKRRARS